MLKTVILCLLPYLPATTRLKFAQAGSIELRRLILSERWEREAFIEYAKFSEVYNLNATWDQEPFRLALPHTCTNAKRLQLRLLGFMRAGIKHWHLACARARRRPRVRRLPRLEGGRWPRGFEALAADSKIPLMLELEAWNTVSTFVTWGVNPILILLLKSGQLYPEKLWSISPVDLITWSQGLAPVEHAKLPPVSEVMSYLEPQMMDMPINDFFSWDYAISPGICQSSAPPLWKSPAIWMRSLVRDSLRADAAKVAWNPATVSVSPRIKAVLFEKGSTEITLYGAEDRCVIPL
eukprot:Blabericola_migrator_1__12973@NODE_860_length_6237_cov_124_199352_g610_i0_p4_GENE_NODE_860_length_6237_cov_124_199352_g610_i0NODE_860_length_6237_cov_124_199352_g610_i0_p4_ORF_typecomplete_len294_score30_49_NODE_860_length_6237_cov_124_199352_g610_i017512632